MILINFSHPITPEQRGQIEALAGAPLREVRDVASHFDMEGPFAPQVHALADAAGLSREEWQGAALIVNLPAHSAIAGALLAELHGRAGHFPAILRLKPRPGPVTVYDAAEILNLQALRDAARGSR